MATWIPKLLSITPGFNLYSSVKVSLSEIATMWQFLTVLTEFAKSVISWKWVAKSVKHFVSLAKCLSEGNTIRTERSCQDNRRAYSAMAQAIPHPSYVDVPLPSSSITTSDFSVAVRIIAEVSIISTMKVLSPLLMLSSAPIRPKIEST